MDNLSQLAGSFADKRDGGTILRLLKGLYNSLSSKMVTSAGLVITATSGKKVPKTGSAISYGLVKGKPFTIAAGVDMPAFVATVTNLAFNVVCFFANAPGTAITASSMEALIGVEAALLKDVKFPPFPEGKALIGYIIINPAGTGNFVCGTDALDDGTIFSSGGVVYLSLIHI